MSNTGWNRIRWNQHNAKLANKPFDDLFGAMMEDCELPKKISLERDLYDKIDCLTAVNTQLLAALKIASKIHGHYCPACIGYDVHSPNCPITAAIRAAEEAEDANETAR